MTNSKPPVVSHYHVLINKAIWVKRSTDEAEFSTCLYSPVHIIASPILRVMRTARYPNTVLILLAIGESGYDVTSTQHIVWVHKSKGTLGSDKGKREPIQSWITPLHIWAFVLIPSDPQKFKLPGLVNLWTLTSSKNDVGIINAKDTTIQEWVIMIIVSGCEQHHILMCCWRINNVLIPLNIIGCVLEPHEFMEINLIALEMYWITRYMIVICCVCVQRPVVWDVCGDGILHQCNFQARYEVVFQLGYKILKWVQT